SRPVVDQTAAEQQLLGLSDRDRAAEFVPAAQPGAELQLEVEERLRPETHVVAARRRFVLPARAYDRGAAGADRTRAAVVGHWQRERGQLRPGAAHAPDVIVGRAEVGERGRLRSEERRVGTEGRRR